ncbi:MULTISPECIES: hypothetical protein [Bradyrhizobium]|uniref:hypothetical protein n=1 Tax=Bradyrhizobium TaxID=374 RepID=UPI000422BC5D|nr:MULTISPECIES: hypothetical protein [Bradyrhizobium]UFW47115.1 hypothetical protein BaraCB756_33255 [Bradyrhizobium arachidis]
MISDLLQDAAAFIQTDLAKYIVATLGLAAFVGIYYLGDYLYRDRAPEGEDAVDQRRYERAGPPARTGVFHAHDAQ